MAFTRAGFMTDPSKSPETPDVVETAGFLRRFADLMSNGYNATYLQRAADLLETLTARVLAASNEDELWRYKYESLAHHANALEAECDALKHDIEGHLSVTSSILSERDALRASRQSRESELSELRDGFDREREALKAALEVRGEELDQLRREREDYTAKLKVCEGELSALRLISERERAELQVQLKAQGGEFTAFRIASDRERDALEEKVASLEAKRAELRAAVDRINDLKNQTIERQGGADRAIPGKPGLEAEAKALPAQRGERGAVVGETSAVVPKTTLRQVRAQFEYLAQECIPRGDIASQVMCELGAHTMDLALTAGGETDRLPVGEVALSILASSGSTSLATADTV
jgi:predicted  nucleic acid-binding Zn-ribbon protein